MGKKKSSADRLKPLSLALFPVRRSEPRPFRNAEAVKKSVDWLMEACVNSGIQTETKYF